MSFCLVTPLTGLRLLKRIAVIVLEFRLKELLWMAKLYRCTRALRRPRLLERRVFNSYGFFFP